MADNKRYYFLKLKDDFFSSEQTQALESEEYGATALLIYLKLQLMSLNDEGKIRKDETTGYKLRALAFMLHTDMDTLGCCLNLLIEYNFIQITSTNIINIIGFEELVSSETKDAERKRIARAKDKVREDYNQSQSKSNEIISVGSTNEDEANEKEIFDNQISLITLESAKKPENRQIFDIGLSRKKPTDDMRTSGGQVADKWRTTSGQCPQDIRDKILDIRDKSVCNKNYNNYSNAHAQKTKIKLTAEEQQHLISMLGSKDSFDCLIEKYQVYQQAYNKAYADDYAALRYWIIKDKEKQEENERVASAVSTQRNKNDIYQQRHYTDAFYAKLSKGRKHEILARMEAN